MQSVEGRDSLRRRKDGARMEGLCQFFGDHSRLTSKVRRCGQHHAAAIDAQLGEKLLTDMLCGFHLLRRETHAALAAVVDRLRLLDERSAKPIPLAIADRPECGLLAIL